MNNYIKYFLIENPENNFFEIFMINKYFCFKKLAFKHWFHGFILINFQMKGSYNIQTKKHFRGK